MFDKILIYTEQTIVNNMIRVFDTMSILDNYSLHLILHSLLRRYYYSSAKVITLYT